MTDKRLSWLAVVSVACGLPPVAASVWCVWVIQTASSAVAGEILLLPAMCWMSFAWLGAVCGVNALSSIRRSGGMLRGWWLAVVGLALAAAPPALYLGVLMVGTVRLAGLL